MSIHTPWTPQEDAELLSLAASRLSDREIAEKLNRSYESIRHRRQRLQGKQRVNYRPEATCEEIATVNADPNSQVITVRSSTIRTLDALLEAAQVDLLVWEVERWTANKWDVGAKLRAGDGLTDNLHALELWQVKAWLRRKVSRTAEQALDGLLNRMKAHSPRYPVLHSPNPRAVRHDPHLLYLGLHDHHFGKLAWSMETGSNYDLKIAEKLYQEAGQELLRKAEMFPVERIVLPLGHDFLHIDGLANTTSGGTPQDVDGRFAKIFQCGLQAVLNLVEFLIQTAPVEILWVPGNHDYQSSYMLAKTIEAWYRRCKRVTVDASPRPRKAIHYGVNLIACTHGCDERHSALPAIMAQEWPAEWAASKCREWLLGHRHLSKETHYNSADTIDGVMVRILPSLAGTDLWHYKKGYVGSKRAAQAFLYSKAEGFAAQFSANVWS